MNCKIKHAGRPTIAALIAALSVMTWAGAAETQPAAKPQTILKFEKSEINVGRIAEGQTKDMVFRFVNEGDSPVTIIKTRSDCSCAGSDWPKKPIAAGATGEIKVKLKTAGVSAGPFVGKVLIVFSMAGKQHEATVKVLAKIHEEGKLAAKPKALRLKGITVGDPLRRQIVLRNLVERFKTGIVKVESPKWLKATFARKPDSNQWILSVSGIVPDKLGRLAENIIVHTDNKTFPKVVIPIRAYIEGVVIAVPGVAYKMVTLQGGDRTAELLIRDKKKRKIESIKLTAAKKLRSRTTSVKWADTANPWEKKLTATLKDGLPKGRTLDLNARVKVTVGGKEYVIPITTTFIKR